MWTKQWHWSCNIRIWTSSRCSIFRRLFLKGLKWIELITELKQTEKVDVKLNWKWGQKKKRKSKTYNREIHTQCLKKYSTIKCFHVYAMQCSKRRDHLTVKMLHVASNSIYLMIMWRFGFVWFVLACSQGCAPCSRRHASIIWQVGKVMSDRLSRCNLRQTSGMTEVVMKETKLFKDNIKGKCVSRYKYVLTVKCV